MKNDIELVANILLKINDKFDGELVSEEKLEELEENVLESVNTDVLNWIQAINLLKNIEFEKKNLENDKNFIQSLNLLNLSLLDISNDLMCLYEVLKDIILNLPEIENVGKKLK